MRSSGLDSASASSSTAAIAGAASSARPNVAGKGEAPAGRMCEVEQARGALGIFRIYYPCVTADRRTVPCDFCFRFSRSVLYLLLVPQKAASAAGSEAGVDCGTALAKQARLRPCGEALRGRIFAGGRAPAPAAGGRVGGKSGSQYKNSNSQARRQWGAVIATPGSSPGGSRGTSGAPHVLLDRHAAKARLKRRASLDALWRLAMTERPLSSEASDRALLGSYAENFCCFPDPARRPLGRRARPEQKSP